MPDAENAADAKRCKRQLALLDMIRLRIRCVQQIQLAYRDPERMQLTDMLTMQVLHLLDLESAAIRGDQAFFSDKATLLLTSLTTVTVKLVCPICGEPAFDKEPTCGSTVCQMKHALTWGVN